MRQVKVRLTPRIGTMIDKLMKRDRASESQVVTHAIDWADTWGLKYSDEDMWELSLDLDDAVGAKLAKLAQDWNESEDQIVSEAIEEYADHCAAEDDALWGSWIGVTIVGERDPYERDAKFGAPLDRALQKYGIGEVGGAGSMITRDGKGAYSDLSLSVYDVEGAVEFVRKKMRRLGAPKGSCIRFRRNGEFVSLPIHARDSVASKQQQAEGITAANA